MASAASMFLAPRAYHQLESHEAALTWARTEGFIATPETSQARAAVIEDAKKAKEESKEKVILFNYSGHGLMDLTTRIYPGNSLIMNCRKKNCRSISAALRICLRLRCEKVENAKNIRFSLDP